MSDEFKDKSEHTETENHTEESGQVNFVMNEPGHTETAENEEKEPVTELGTEPEMPKEEWYAEEKKKEYHSYEYAEPEQKETGKKANKDKKQKKSPLKVIGLTVVCALIFGLVAGFVIHMINPAGIGSKKDVVLEETQTVAKENNADNASAMGVNTVAQVTKNAMPSIVSIVSVSVQELPEIFQYFYGQEVQEEKSSGSGIIVGQNDKELLIATNNHVVNGADPLTVIFTNQDGSAVTSNEKEDVEEPGEEQGSAVNAQVKGTDPDNDLAVVSVKLEDIPKDILDEIKIASIGDSDSLALGEQVVAIGNALGYGQSVTSGYISALNRKVSSDNADSTFIQTDAAINPGNSGGALLNMKGELVGINSAKIASSEVEGVGFAIPISTAQPILDELMSKETRYKVEDENKAAYIGITATDVTEDAVQVYGMPIGVFVYGTEEGGPAEEAGIRKGDVILKMDGNTLKTRTDLIDKLAYYEAGEEIEVVVSRQEEGEWKEEKLTVKLGAKKDMTQEEKAE